uniref:Uncharacterized protein n=1 Tax=Anguilla anguilla TaxID=7936 RepID=A0A0E9PDC5_ANGAN
MVAIIACVRILASCNHNNLIKKQSFWKFVLKTKKSGVSF